MKQCYERVMGMKEKRFHSIDIGGMGKYAGGEFDRVNISGTGKVEGHLKCNELNVSGMIRINGDLASGKNTISGTARIEGDILGDKMTVSGMLKATGGCSIKEALINGMMKLGKSSKIAVLDNNGSLTVEGNLSGEQLKSDGMIDCSGLLNCEDLEMRLSGVSHINEIGAATIKVKDSHSVAGALLSFLVPKKFRTNQLVAEVIEGDNIYLESCEAKVVRGKKVVIGPCCKIDTVEYMDGLEINENSTVANSYQQ